MPTTRREFLRSIAAGSAALGVGWTAGGLLEPAEAAAVDAARPQAARRRRRVIFNNDGDDIWAEGADSTEAFLAVRHEPLLGTHVDSIYYCTTQSFNLFTHNTQVAEVFRSREGSFAHNNLPKFLEQKTDGLRMSCEFARRHGLECLWTLRMNDIHDAWTPQFVSQWKKDDPRRVMSTLEATADYNDRRRLWSLVDFEHPDVQPTLVAIIAEVLRCYPVDGVEIDFLRAPFYFRTSYTGEPATPQQVDVLTRLVRSIRELVLSESMRQGKPLLLAARVPVTAALCRRIGIDVEAWLEERLIDTLALGGGYVAFDQPVDELAALAHSHGVPVYPCLSQSGLLYRPPRGTGEPQPTAAWNGAALRLWEAGADGIYTFNLFPGPGPKSQYDDALTILKTIGSPDQLRASDAIYAISDAGTHMPAHYWAKDAEEFSGALPAALNAAAATTVCLHVAGQLTPPTAGQRLELRLDFTGLAESDVPAVRLNDSPLKPDQVETVAGVRRHRFAVPADTIGANTTKTHAIAVSRAPDGAMLVGAELWLQNKG